MGCLQSKKEVAELHPNIFRVVNIDERGVELCSGQLEISDSEIVLYREGREQTVWPLHSLRRYGFEGELFSFESGRRCETGEGIYAFRCRRAAALFRALQQQIQVRNVTHDQVSYPATGTSPSAHGRQTLQASVVHRSSIDNGPPENNNNQDTLLNPTVSRTTLTPRSPSSAEILEVMPLYPRPTNSTVTNVYQVGELKKEHNNNQSGAGTEVPHLYCNDLNRDLAILRNTLRQEAAMNTMRDIEDETQFLEGRLIINEGDNQTDQTLSPTLSSSSEHYAALSMEQQIELDTAQRPYMNLAPLDKIAIIPDKIAIKPDKIAILPDKFANKPDKIANKPDKIAILPDKNVILPDLNKLEPPQTPLTPKAADYCNLNMSLVFKPELNSYANLSAGEISDTIKAARQGSHVSVQEHSQKFSESDTFTSMSPVEELEVNYAVLDIDSNGKEIPRATRDLVSPESQSFSSSKNESTASCSSNARARLVSQSSLEKPTSGSTSSNAPNIGYTTIDFEKTVALTAVKPRKGHDDANRKTRLDPEETCPKTP